MTRKSKRITFSKAAISRYAKNTDLFELIQDTLRLRFHQCRTRATWYLVYKEKWKKLGYWPDRSLECIRREQSAKLAILSNQPNKHLNQEFFTVEELLSWYQARSQTQTISKQRKAQINTIITRHLIPNLGDIRLCDLSRAILDERLFCQLQSELSSSYLRSIYVVLRAACNLAYGLGRIPDDPMHEFRFEIFVSKAIQPENTQLYVHDLPRLCHRINSAESPEAKMLHALMLCYGTRIRETALAKWRHVSLELKRWVLPAEDTKTKVVLELPLSDLMVQLLLEYRKDQQRRGYQGAFLFPNATRSRAVSKSAMYDWFREVSLRQWNGRSLRKLYRTTHSREIGTEHLVGEMLINHTLSTLTDTYMQDELWRFKCEAVKAHHIFLRDQGFIFCLKSNPRHSQDTTNPSQGDSPDITRGAA